MHPFADNDSWTALRSRRDFLRRAAHGFGGLAFATLLANDSKIVAGIADDGMSPFLPKNPHFEPKAKSVIFLFMEGGPSHIDLFDPKPELTRMHGKPLPARFGKVITPMGTGGNTLLASKRTFPNTESLAWNFRIGCLTWPRWPMSLPFCEPAGADGLNHVGAVCQMNTGQILAGRPSLGAWARVWARNRQSEFAWFRGSDGRWRSARRRSELGHGVHAGHLSRNVLSAGRQTDSESQIGCRKRPPAR